MAFLVRRRWIAGILRSGRQLAANRMITSGSGSGGGGVESPWLMMEPEVSESGTVFRFWCCTKEREHSYEYELWNWRRRHVRSRGGGVQVQGVNFIEGRNLQVAKLVGSSQGWLAYKFKCCIYLIDPTTYRCIRLPDVLAFEQRNMNVTRVVLSRDHERDELGKAFMICGTGSLAFCSPGQGQGGEWSILSERDVEYESVVYSSIHRRLLCLTHTMKLEAWDVAGDGESPRLDWAVQLQTHPVHLSLQGWLRNLRYLACAEQTGDLFLVVRFFKKIKRIQYDYDYDYEEDDPTVYFEVYKIDRQQGSIIKMDHSLEGMSIFVGINDSIALKIKIPQEEEEEEEEEEASSSIRRDCVHFTYDGRIGRNKYIGVFDYKTRVPYPLPSISFPDQFLLAAHDIDVDYPLWFTPAPASPIGTIHNLHINH